MFGMAPIVPCRLNPIGNPCDQRCRRVGLKPRKAVFAGVGLTYAPCLRPCIATRVQPGDCAVSVAATRDLQLVAMTAQSVHRALGGGAS